MTCKKCEKKYKDEKGIGLQKEVFCPSCRLEPFWQFMVGMAERRQADKEMERGRRERQAKAEWRKKERERQWRVAKREKKLLKMQEDNMD